MNRNFLWKTLFIYASLTYSLAYSVAIISGILGAEDVAAKVERLLRRPEDSQQQ